LPIINTGENQEEVKTCSCKCRCFGFFDYKGCEWNDFNMGLLEQTEFEEGSIKILYRDSIRVFYSTVAQAK